MNNRRVIVRDDLLDRINYAWAYSTRFRRRYTAEYYTVGDNPERKSWGMGIIRPGDMGAAILYALGAGSYDEVVRIMDMPPGDPRHLPSGTTALQQSAVLARHVRRDPGFVVDMGCGRGEVAATLAHLGMEVVAVDPSAHAGRFVQETARRFYGMARPIPFRSKSCYAALRGLGRVPDTVIFCESIEHIPEGEVVRAFELLSRMAGKRSIRVVITNWIDFHPIRRSGRDWDHLHDVDDAFYDRLESYADRTVFRRGSHFVLDIGSGHRERP